MNKIYFCTICGRKHNGKSSSKYCRKHYLQLKKYGKVLDTNPRTKFDKNEYRFKEGDIVEFDTYKAPTYDVDNTYIIDAEDYPLVSKYKWNTHKMGYACTLNYNGKSYLLHRLVTNAKIGQQVDHINGNKLDNRKVNLRICNNSLNQTNKAPYNKLDIKGVQYHKKENKYSAYLRKDSKQYHSRCYKTKEEAAFARFILEQLFLDYDTQQFSSNLVNTLSEEQKGQIIKDTKSKFNID